MKTIILFLLAFISLNLYSQDYSNTTGFKGNVTATGNIITKTWQNVSGTRTANTTFTFTGTVNDVAKYNRSIFTCLGAIKDVTCNAASNYIKFVSITRLKVGDMIWFNSGTLPTASPVLVTGRAYWVQAAPATGDSIKISETPNGAAIDLTTDGSSVKIRDAKIGYVSGLTISGTTLTATVVTDTAMTATDSLFRLTQHQKYTDYSKSIYTGIIECTADASNPQGRRLLNYPENAYLLSTSAALATAASGAGATCVYNVYSGATALYSSAPDLTTNLTLSNQVPTIKFIASTSNVTLRNTSVGGATTKPAYLEVDLILVPCNIFQNF